jgi:protein-S-isoprenylcysteine O-methyltransferase Ste14
LSSATASAFSSRYNPITAFKTDGFYRFVRHPSYLGALLAMAGWALAFRSVIGLLLTAAMCVPIIARIHAEEEFLVHEFGEQYRAYQQRTPWRLLPFVY